MAERLDHSRPHLYIGTRRGVFGALLTAGEAEVFPVALWNTPVTSLMVSPSGELRAAATRANGLQAGSLRSLTPAQNLEGATLTAVCSAENEAYAGLSPASLYRSQDGSEWVELSSFRGPWTQDWPSGDDAPWVSCLLPLQGALFVGIRGGGVVRTADSGRTFELLSDGLDTMVRALAARSETPNVLYAGTEAGLFLSEKGGYGWTRVDHDPKRQAVTTLALHPTDSQFLMVGSANRLAAAKPAEPAGADAILHRSTDGGRTFEELGARNLPIIRGVFTRILFDPTRPDRLFAGSSSGELFQSDNGGSDWRLIAATLPGVLAVELGPELASPA